MCIACPTLFAKLTELEGRNNRIFLLEYDHRFSVYGDQFVFYDYNSPEDIPQHLSAFFRDCVISVQDQVAF